MTARRTITSHGGLHADPKALKNLGPSCWPLDGRPDSQEARIAAGAGAADFVADVSWRALGAVAGADFFTTAVWTWRGLVTFYTVFVIDLASRRVQIVGSTPHPDDLFMRHAGRTLIATDGLLSDHRVLIGDRDRKWSRDVQRLLGEAGVHVVQTPFQAVARILHRAEAALLRGPTVNVSTTPPPRVMKRKTASARVTSTSIAP